MEDVGFDCKYCRANTAHISIGEAERDAIKGTVYKCKVCNYTSFMYRGDKGIVVDQSEIPERLVDMPHDLNSMQNDIVDETQEQTNKDIDEWLRNPNHFPVTKRGGGR